MPGEQRGNEGAGPNSTGLPRRIIRAKAGQPQQQHEKQNRIRRVKQDVLAMRHAWVAAGHLAVRHVRQPGERMPVARVPRRERPFDAGPRQAVLNHGIFGDVIAVVIEREVVMRRRQINRQRAHHEQQHDETGSGHRLLVWDFCPETKRVFSAKKVVAKFSRKG